MDSINNYNTVVFPVPFNWKLTFHRFYYTNREAHRRIAIPRTSQGALDTGDTLIPKI